MVERYQLDGKISDNVVEDKEGTVTQFWSNRNAKNAKEMPKIISNFTSRLCIYGYEV